MAHHARTDTRTIILSSTDIPGTLEAFTKFNQHKSLELFSQVAKICVFELSDCTVPNISLPKDIQNALIHYLSTMEAAKALDLYIPCLNLLQVLLSLSIVKVPQGLVNQLCACLAELKTLELSSLVIVTAFTLIDTLFHLALSRRKRSENLDLVWIQKIYLCLNNLLIDLLTRPEIKELATSEHFSSRERVSVDSRVLKYVNDTDLVLYITSALAQIAKFITNVIPNELLSVTIPALFNHTIQAFGEKDEANYLRVGIALEKTVATFALLNTICALTAKLDTGRQFFKVQSDKIKLLFYCCTLEFIKTRQKCSSIRFEEDESVIGRLFTQLYELSSSYLIQSDMEAFPLTLFSNFLQPEFLLNLYKTEPFIQVFTLTFIDKYFTIGLKKTKLTDTNLSNLMLTSDFFCLPNNDPGNLAQQSWASIWKNITANASNFEWISSAVILQLKRSQSDISYLQKMNSWIREQSESHPDLLELYISGGLLEEMFSGILSVKSSLVNNEFFTEFFIMIKSIICMFEVSISVEVSERLVSLMLQESVIYDSGFSELSLSCLVILMRRQDISSYKKYLQMLRDAKSFEVAKRLLQSIQDILKDSSSKKECQENFVKAGLLSQLNDILLESYKEHYTELIWVASIECVRFIIQDNEFCRESLKEVDFKGLSSAFIKEEFRDKRMIIYKQSIESLLMLLMSCSNLESPKAITNPEVVPLLITMVCTEFSTFTQFTAEIISIPYNASLFSMHYATEFLLLSWNSTESPEILEFIQESLSKILSYNIPPQDMQSLIKTLVKSHLEKQLLLLQSINKGFKKAFLVNYDSEPSQLKHRLEPSNFVWFNQRENYIEITTEDFDLFPKKSFTIILWVFPSVATKGTLLDFCDGKSQFLVNINGKAVEVVYINEKKVAFKITTEKIVNEGRWNLICVAMQQFNKLISTVSSLDVFINCRLCEKTVEGKLCAVNNWFNRLFIGNSSDLKNPFNGKLSFMVVLSKYFSNFSMLYELRDEMHLPFVPEAISLHQSFDNKTFKEFSKNKHFEYFSHFPSEFEGKVQIKTHATVINGLSLVHSISMLGGVLVILPIFKDSFNDPELVLSIFEFISIFSRSRSLNSLFSKDFFEIFSSILENNIYPSEKLLKLTEEILENLEWQPQYQHKVFMFILCNSKVWTNLLPDLQPEYLSILSHYAPKHLEFNLSSCSFLFSHLNAIKLTQNSNFVDFFIKILPRTQFNSENLDAIAYLMFKMVRDCPQMMQTFLEELSLIKISRKWVQELIFLFMHFMEWNQEPSVQAGVLRMLKSLMVSTIFEGKREKKDLNPDIFMFALKIIDEKLDKALTLEIFQAIMDLIIYSFTITRREEIDTKNDVNLEFLCRFLDIVCKRFAHLSENIKEELHKALSDYQFCELIVNRDSFPLWLLDAWVIDPEPSEAFALKLFSQSANWKYIQKLRIYIIAISKNDVNAGLQFYQRILFTLKSSNGLNDPLNFLDFSGLLEDVINPEVSGRSLIEIDLFSEIIERLVDLSIELSLVQCSYPPLPRMDFSLQYDLLKSKPIDASKSPENVILKEGGFFRIILKYLFIAIQINPTQRLLDQLHRVLISGSNSELSLILDASLKQENEKIILESNCERASVSYSKFPSREPDLLYTKEFISFYMLTELTEILNNTNSPILIGFLHKFLNEVNVEKLLLAWSKKLSSKELEDFYKMLNDYKFLFFATCRSRFPQMERNAYLQQMKTLVPTSLQSFQNSFSEQITLLSSSKLSVSTLKSLLSGKDWLVQVHFFLLAFTSMKINFISTMTKLPILSQKPFAYPSVFSEDYQTKLNEFIYTKQEYLKQWQINFSESQEKFTQVFQSRFLNVIDYYRKVNFAFLKGKVKLRWNLDSVGRMAACIRQKNKERFSVRRSKTIHMPVETRFKASIVITLSTESSANESVDDSEIGTYIPEPEDESVEPSLKESQKTVKVECERIKVSYSLFGEIEVSQDYILFSSEGKEKPLDGKYFGSALKFTQECNKSIKFIEVADILEVFPRRFIHKHTAFELFLRTGKTAYFNVFTPELRESVFEVIKTWKHVKLVLDTNSQHLKHFTRKWKRCLISNFEYLMILNKFASRSFNDISQYPVFPWVIKDYYSSELKLEDSHMYRNFKCPIGAQSESGRQEADRRFSMWVEEQPYHFGSHYSSGAIVLHYLVRIEPFTTQAKILQGGRFDIADRLFHSIKASWESGQGVNGDVKELVPEMFYLPEILMNLNNEEFGSRQDDEEVADVELPRWASSPIDFIRKHRLALESNHVSQNLNNWIDLVFGSKQKGKQAQNSYNLFCPMTYEDQYNKLVESSEEGEAMMQGMVDQVVHFGQTPVRLFKSPHVARDSKPVEMNIFDKYRKFSECVSNGCETNGQIGALVFTSKFLLIFKFIYGRVSVIRVALNEFDSNRIIFEKKKEKILIGCNIITAHSGEFLAVWNEDHIVSGGQVDKSFRIFSLNGVLESAVFAHSNLVTSVHTTTDYIITGSKDSSIFSWAQTRANEKGFHISVFSKYLGHVSEILMIRSLESYQMLFSLGINGDLLLHDLRNGECIKGIKTNAIGFSVSNLGIIASYTSTEINVYTINESNILKKHIEVNKAIFDVSGENIFYCNDSCWGFFNLFEDHKKFEKAEELQIGHIALPMGNEYFVHSETNGKLSYVLTYEIINKEIHRVIRRHNILQD